MVYQPYEKLADAIQVMGTNAEAHVVEKINKEGFS